MPDTFGSLFPVLPYRLAIVWMALNVGCQHKSTTDPQPKRQSITSAPIRANALPAIATWVNELVSTPSAQPPHILRSRLLEANHGVFVAARLQGKKLGDTWQLDGTVENGVRAAFAKLRAELERADTVELCLAHSYRSHRLTGPKSKELDKKIGNIYRGRRGLKLSFGDIARRYAPTELLARNLSFGRALERWLKANRISANSTPAIDIQTFECEQLLIERRPTPRAHKLYRGNTVIEPAQVTASAVADFKTRMGDWMLSNLHDDGRMTYKWWPSRGSESRANNMIRQWMATIALTRLALDRPKQPALFERAAQNIRYNLQHFFYKNPAGLGFIEGKLPNGNRNGKVKLGAIALAALAIVEHPKRAQWRDQERALVAATTAAHKANGRFQTFYKPARADRNHNFYPGETLLLWSTLYAESRDPALLKRFMQSFRYYRSWHRDHRNPAFIPWHTQAYWNVWQITKDDELASFIFEMNDWLVPFQAWLPNRFPDTLGRFYRNGWGYGPPHASSTGVYLEGLIDAAKLAAALGDGERLARYKRAITRGIRSSMQLQFADNIDMYYVANKPRVRGGLRTTVYDNTIRVDNVQHTLLAAFRIHKYFAPTDYDYK